MLHPSSQGHGGNARKKSSATLRILVTQPLEAGSRSLGKGVIKAEDVRSLVVLGQSHQQTVEKRWRSPRSFRSSQQVNSRLISLIGEKFCER
jgi:hypothetical protein